MSPASNKSLAFVMDPIESIKAKKDSTVTMMKAAAHLGRDIYYMTIDDLFIEDKTANTISYKLNLTNDPIKWYELEAASIKPLTDFEAVWMRKDPPVDKRFIHACYMLEHAARNGANILNNPTALIGLNEKLYATHFPDLCPETLVSSDIGILRKFLDTHKKIIIKPLDAMGGSGVFMVTSEDVNFEVIWEIHTNRGTYPVIAQAFLPSIVDGDKRIIVINGKAFDHVLVRSPKEGSIRGNMAAGGSTQVREITAKEREICDIVGQDLVKRGIVFAGVDIIGDKLIEINITSPTGLREISTACGTDVAEILMKESLR